MTDHPALTAALRELTIACPAYVKAGQFYDGEVPEFFASDKLRHALAGQSKHYRINYARTPVDVMVERTTVQGWSCSDAGQLKIIDQAWKDNQLGIEAKDVSLKAYEYGDSYLIAGVEEDRTVFPCGVSTYLHDPVDVRVFYDPERPRQKSHAIHRWLELGNDDNELGEGTWLRIAVYYPDRVEQWVSREPAIDAVGNKNMPKDDDDYRLLEELEPDVPGVIPVFHFRTGRPYGRPEHADAYGPQESINKLLLSLVGTIDHQVIPKRYVLTDSEVDSSMAPDPFAAATGEVTIDPEGIPPITVDGLDSKSELSDDPGDVWLLSGKNVRAGQFAAADTKNFTAPMDSLIQYMADVTDMPADRYHRGGQASSGESKRFDEIPLNKKVSDRQDQFGVTWAEWAAYVLLINGYTETDAVITWDPPVAYNDLAAWQTAALQRSLGVPFAQVMKERGYTTAQIEDFMRTNATLVHPTGDPTLSGQLDTGTGGTGDAPPPTADPATLLS